MVRRLFLACFLCVCLLLAASSAMASFDEDGVLDSNSFLDIGSDIACLLAKCLKGKCVNSSSFPFYKCECDAGWQSPFGASWLPCLLPNCSIDLTCANHSAVAPAPSTLAPSLSGLSDICSFHVCGNGECIHNSSTASNGTDDYECACDSGYINLGNKVDGYCIRKCSLGAGCTNVSLPIIGGNSPPSPPPPASASSTSSSSPSSNQGHLCAAGNILLAVTLLMQLIF